MMNKKIISFVLAVTLLLGLAGCGSGAPVPSSGSASGSTEPVSDNKDNPAFTKPAGNVDISVWYAISGASGEAFTAKVEEYQKLNPNIHIELVYSGSYADTAAKVSANLATNSAPDVALMAAGPLYTGSRNDYTIEELIKDPAFDKEDIYDGVWEYAMFNGRICAIPYGISTPVLFYNKAITDAAGIDMEKETPKTWEELYALAEKAQKNGNINGSSAFYGFEVSDAPWLFKTMLSQNGNSVIQSEGGKIVPVYNEPSAVEVADFWQKLVSGGIMPVGEHANAEKTFLAGNSAFMVASSVRVARWAADPVIDFGVIPMPAFKEEKVALGGNVLVTFAKDADKLAASWDLIKFLTNVDNHTDFALQTGYLPIHKSALDTDTVKSLISEDSRRQIAFNQLAHSWAYWHFDEMGTMDSVLGSTIQNIEKGGSTQAILDQAVNDLNREM